MGLTAFIRDTAPKVYSGPVRQLGEILGADRYLQRAYDELESRTTPDSHRIEIGGASATFATQRIQEYRRVTKFVEPEGIKDFVAELQVDDVVWDIGANIGIYTCIAADFLSDGQVVAFEPHPGNVSSLKKNIATNDIDNVDVQSLALSDEDGTTELHVTGSVGGLGLHSLTTGKGNETLDIETRQGDSLITDGETVPSVIKIDVEGAEGKVIDGMTEILSDPICRVVYCEVHGSKSLSNSTHDFGYTPEMVEEQLREAGFSLEVVDDGGAYMLKGTRSE